MLTLLHLSDKRAEDQPKSPVVASNADLVVQEMPQQEAEKSIKGSTAVAQGILGCHSVLVVSNFCTRVLVCCRVLCLDCVLLTGSS